MQDIFAVNSNGRSFVKFRIDVLNNEVTVNSYLNVIDVNGNIMGARLDPYSKYTWFNSQVRTSIKTNYNSEFGYDPKPLSITYDGRNTFTYYGNNISFDYYKVDGYTLATIKLYGVEKKELKKMQVMQLILQV